MSVHNDVVPTVARVQVPYGQPVLFSYSLVASIVMVNLLVAMFADTYAKVARSSQEEFRFQKKYLIFLYQHVVLVVPPPFNLPRALPELAWHYCLRCAGENDDVSAEGLHGFSKAAEGSLNDGSRIYLEKYLKLKEMKDSNSVDGLVRFTSERVAKVETDQAALLDLVRSLELKLMGQLQNIDVAKLEASQAASLDLVRMVNDLEAKLTQSLQNMDLAKLEAYHTSSLDLVRETESKLSRGLQNLDLTKIEASQAASLDLVRGLDAKTMSKAQTMDLVVKKMNTMATDMAQLQALVIHCSLGQPGLCY